MLAATNLNETRRKEGSLKPIRERGIMKQEESGVLQPCSAECFNNTRLATRLCQKQGSAAFHLSIGQLQTRKMQLFAFLNWCELSAQVIYCILSYAVITCSKGLSSTTDLKRGRACRGEGWRCSQVCHSTP